MPAGKGEEWVYVDLGAVCTFDRVVLPGSGAPPKASIQVSDDAAKWIDRPDRCRPEPAPPTTSSSGSR